VFCSLIPLKDSAKPIKLMKPINIVRIPGAIAAKSELIVFKKLARITKIRIRAKAKIPYLNAL